MTLEQPAMSRGARKNSSVRLVQIDELAPHVEAMWSLYQQYYRLPREQFRERLRDYERCALFFSGGALVGYTFVKIERDAVVRGERCVLVGFGTTVLALHERNRNFMQRAVTRLFLLEKLRNPLARVYLWTVAATCRPYLIFARHLATAFPTRRTPRSGLAEAIVEHLGQTHFSRGHWRYHPELGAVSLDVDDVIKDPSVRVTESDLHDPDIAYFQARIDQVQASLGNPQATVGVLTVAPADGANFAHWLGVLARKTLTRVSPALAQRLGA